MIKRPLRGGDDPIAVLTIHKFDKKVAIEANYSQYRRKLYLGFVSSRRSVVRYPSSLSLSGFLRQETLLHIATLHPGGKITTGEHPEVILRMPSGIKLGQLYGGLTTEDLTLQ